MTVFAHDFRDMLVLGVGAGTVREVRLSIHRTAATRGPA
jgi:hypothetical protein